MREATQQRADGPWTIPACIATGEPDEYSPQLDVKGVKAKDGDLYLYRVAGGGPDDVLGAVSNLRTVGDELWVDVEFSNAEDMRVALLGVPALMGSIDATLPDGFVTRSTLAGVFVAEPGKACSPRQRWDLPEHQPVAPSDTTRATSAGE